MRKIWISLAFLALVSCRAKQTQTSSEIAEIYFADKTDTLNTKDGILTRNIGTKPDTMHFILTKEEQLTLLNLADSLMFWDLPDTIGGSGRRSSFLRITTSHSKKGVRFRYIPTGTERGYFGRVWRLELRLYDILSRKIEFKSLTPIIGL